MQIGSNINDRAQNADYFEGRTSRSGAEGRKGGIPEGTEREETVDFMNILREKKQEIFKKVMNGETEPKIQIGSQAFTEKEWDRLLKQFDSAEDAIKEKMREEYAKRLKKQTGDVEERSSEEESRDKEPKDALSLEELLEKILIPL